MPTRNYKPEQIVVHIWLLNASGKQRWLLPACG